jgi:HD-GYP domain-containing protein (c-di-GMP phosphodiesterase class II)
MYNIQPQYTAAQINKLSAIDTALGTKDPYTQGHARRVSVYAMRLASRMGLTAEEVRHIGIGGMLHDVGKIGLNERIFDNTTGHLCQEMQAEVRRHPYLGVLLLEGSDFPTPVLDYIYYHHERMDGSGYPCGLKADDIPLGAKIIAVADCFDAITTDRPYQKRKSCRDAIALLHAMSGDTLCSDLVTAFVNEIEENGMLECRFCNIAANPTPQIPNLL